MTRFPRPRVWRLASGAVARRSPGARAPGWHRSDVAEFLLQCDPLIRAKSADSPRLSDAQTLHDLLGADLAHARHGLKQRRDLHLPDDIVSLTVLEDLRQGRRGV